MFIYTYEQLFICSFNIDSLYLKYVLNTFSKHSSNIVKHIFKRGRYMNHTHNEEQNHHTCDNHHEHHEHNNDTCCCHKISNEP